MEFLFTQYNLALIFAALTAISILLYAILDGYDLGVGILLPMHDADARDVSIASIGPFWDANETWLVLAVGLLLVAFPSAHSAILKVFYLPATFMLFGLILRGVAFDFRAKVKQSKKRRWDYAFKCGSIITAFTQGFMLGMYVMGLEYSASSIVFACFSGLCVCAAYALIGATWLVMKTSGGLQMKAVKDAKRSGIITFSGILIVCLINPIVNQSVLQVWTQVPWAYFYAAIPMLCFAMFGIGYGVLKRFPTHKDQGAWLPFMITCIVFVSCFLGLAFSFYPYIVPGQMTIFEAASSKESLSIIFVGSVFVLPFIAAYTFIAYYIFRGKAKRLTYY